MKIASFKPVAALISKELIVSFLLLLGVSMVVFAVLWLAPGSPFKTSASERTAAVPHGTAASGSPVAQYGLWVSELLRGNLGHSLRTGLPVLSEVYRTGVNTFGLMVGALALTLLIAVPIAVLGARRGLTPASWSLTMFTYVVSALPVFWLGYIVIYISIHRFGFFPLAFGSGGRSAGWIGFALPMAVLGLSNGTLSEFVRYLRQEITRVFEEEYILAARAKGASIWKHGFKEGFLIPITGIVSAKIPYILGGAVVVEQVFNWPGMGRMAWQAAQDRDYPLIMGITLTAAVLVRLGSLVQRVVHISVNPRASKE
jgi:peptide/nickel transport system permease protein